MAISQENHEVDSEIAGWSARCGTGLPCVPFSVCLRCLLAALLSSLLLFIHLPFPFPFLPLRFIFNNLFD